MGEIKEKTPADIINDLMPQYSSQREFARAIGEDAADIIRWRYGRSKIKTRAVITLCRLHPEIKPYQLNSEWFPKDLRFVFGDESE
jgi:hypothetical protein